MTDDIGNLKAYADNGERIDRELTERGTSWYRDHRGVRVILALGREEFHLSEESARRIRDGLSAVLVESEGP